jgi:peptide/nickel transport system ATP-binding protein
VSGHVAALLEVRDLVVDYPLPRRMFRRRRVHRAVDHVSFDIAPGETLGLVGESGSGKSTIGRAILGLLRPASGTITFDGVELTTAPAPLLRRLRPDIQVVFQNPYASLNPALTIGDAIGEPIHVHKGLSGQELDDAVADLLRLVGLDPAMAGRYPRAFSGGQRQRIAVARAMALRPRLLIADEPVSALDVSTRGQIVNLLEDLSTDMGLADLFIGHDLAVVRHISDRIAVLYRGQLVELGPADDVADHPRHPYTQKLVDAVPVPDPREQARRRSARPRAVSTVVPSPRGVRTAWTAASRRTRRRAEFTTASSDVTSTRPLNGSLHVGPSSRSWRRANRPVSSRRLAFSISSRPRPWAAISSSHARPAGHRSRRTPRSDVWRPSVEPICRGS